MRTQLSPALIAAIIATFAMLSIASAGDETSTPPTDFAGLPPCDSLKSTPLCPRLDQDDAGRYSITWQEIADASSYRIEADGGALRVNAGDPFCTAPLSDDVYGIGIDIPVPADVSELPLPLPRLPAVDAWFIKDIRVTVTALDANNDVLETDGFALTAEAGCDDASGRRPPSTAATQLPGAGASGGDYDHAAKAPIGIALAIIGAAILAYALWKQSRSSGQ